MIIYHHNDADGRCAGAVAWHVHAKKNEECKFVECDYKDKFAFLEVEQDEEVIIVDFSFKPKVMDILLAKTKNVIWIDHHKSAMEFDYGIELKGIRSNDYAACMLAWMYFTDDDNPQNVPWAVKYVSDYDNWNMDYGDETLHFYEGLKMIDHAPKAEFWNNTLKLDVPVQAIAEIANAGFFGCTYRDMVCTDIRDAYAYEVEFEGHKALCLNLIKFGSFAFGKKFKEYDICIAYVHTSDKFTVSMYSDNKVDVSVIAIKHGGGGHAGAAGFTCTELPFKKVTECIGDKINE